uniref:hypothetical protein n=1 Tax=Brevundimonas sp. FT23028 TaxID=3393748 RepID=UPI003B588057
DGSTFVLSMEVLLFANGSSDLLVYPAEVAAGLILAAGPGDLDQPLVQPALPDAPDVLAHAAFRLPRWSSGPDSHATLEDLNGPHPVVHDPWGL